MSGPVRCELDMGVKCPLQTSSPKTPINKQGIRLVHEDAERLLHEVVPISLPRDLQIPVWEVRDCFHSSLLLSLKVNAHRLMSISDI